MKKEGQTFSLLPLLSAFVFCIILALSETLVPESEKNGGMTPWRAERDVLPGRNVSESFLPRAAEQKTENVLPEVYVRNDTGSGIDKDEILGRNVRVKKTPSGVSVIVVHTHGTEAYTQDGGYTYTESDLFRTTDAEKNVVRVGEELCRELESRGIKTAHYTDYCDYPNYAGAYDRSFDLIEKALSEHPEATVIIDLHRDAIQSADGSYYRPQALIEGEVSAQVELVCGTDGGGLSHPYWRDNLSFQLYLQQRIESMYPGLMRPLNLRNARFNQHFSRGSMLVEMGTCGNTLSEALAAARFFARALAMVLSE